MHPDDRIRLQHMMDAATEAISFAASRTREDLNRDRMLALALVREIEVIGEAASRVSTATRNEAPGFPWADVVGMRNRLVHAYFDIDLDVVWATVVDDLPILIELLDDVLTPESP
jgi:uncharacterized protein with HEPN domain